MMSREMISRSFDIQRLVRRDHHVWTFSALALGGFFTRFSKRGDRWRMGSSELIPNGVIMTARMAI